MAITRQYAVTTENENKDSASFKRRTNTTYLAASTELKLETDAVGKEAVPCGNKAVSRVRAGLIWSSYPASS